MFERGNELTFLPSRNLTFPSIIQLLSTIVEGRCYCTGFRCFSHHYIKALRLLNAAYRDTIRTPWDTVNADTFRCTIFHSLKKNGGLTAYESRGKIHTPHRRHQASILTILACCVHCCGPAPFRKRILHIIHSPALWSSGVVPSAFLLSQTSFLSATGIDGTVYNDQIPARRRHSSGARVPTPMEFVI